MFLFFEIRTYVNGEQGISREPTVNKEFPGNQQSTRNFQGTSTGSQQEIFRDPIVKKEFPGNQ